MILRRLALAGLALVVLVVGVLIVFQRPIGAALLGRVADTQVGRDSVADMPDGLNVALCGTGSPMPDPTRAGPCSAVIVGGKVFLIDSGEGAARTLSRMGIPASRIEAIFLTHFHSDHIDGLPPVLLQSWVSGTRTRPTPLYGPEGVERVAAGFNAAYALDTGYRVAHHGAAITPPTGQGASPVAFSIEGAAAAKGLVVYSADGLVVTAFTVQHDPVHPAVGYRFDAGGRSVVITGDTAPTPMIAQMAKGADILIAEALSMRMTKAIEEGSKAAGNVRQAKLMADVQDYHIDPVDGAKAANESGVKLLIYSHLAPNLPMPVLEKLFFDGVSAIRDPATWVVGFDGMRVDLPFAGGAPVSSKITMPGRN
jgi:ribonuclease Z